MKRLFPLMFLGCARACPSAPVPAIADAAREEASAPEITHRCDEQRARALFEGKSVELGPAITRAGSVALGAVVSGRATLAIVSDKDPRVFDLGAQDPSAPPPIPIDADELHVARVAPDPRRVVIERVTAEGPKPAWELALASQDPIELDVAIARGAAVIAFTFGDRVLVSINGRAPEAIPSSGQEISAPRLIAQPAGALLAYLAQRTSAADAAPWYDKEAAPEGRAERLLEGSIEILRAGEDGRFAALTTARGRYTAFDWARTSPEAVDLVARNAIRAGEGASLVHLRIERGVASAARDLGGDVGAGGPSVLALNAETWVAFADPTESIRLMRVADAAVTREPAFGSARPVSGALEVGPKTTLAAVGVDRDGRAEVKILSCGR